MHFTKADLKTAKICVPEIRLIQMVVWFRRRPFLFLLHRVVLHSTLRSEAVPSFARLKASIFRALLFASDLSEYPRFLLLKLWSHTAQNQPRRDVLRPSRQQSNTPNPNVSPKCPFHLLSMVVLEIRLFLFWLSFGLLHQFAWLVLRCLCFWRTESWIRKFFVRDNMSANADGFYLQILAIPYSFLNLLKSDTGIVLPSSGEKSQS